MRHCFVIIVCIASVSCFRETSQTFYSDNNFFSDNNYGCEISYLFKLTGDNVVEYGRKSMPIKLPGKIKLNQSAWGSIYSGAAGKTKWEMYFIISDFDSVWSQIIFDKNKNLDFTDDSSITIQKDTAFMVVFTNPQDQRAEFRYSFRYYNKGPVDSSRAIVHKIMTLNMGEPLPATYMLCASPFKIKKIKLADGNIVTLKDADSDGMFTGKNDRIIAGDLEADPGLLKRRLQCKEVKYGVELPFGKNTYKLVSADKYGKSVAVNSLNKIIDTVENLATIIYTNENERKQILRLKNDKQYSVFYIWGTWCIGCLYQSKTFAGIMDEFKSKANFYTLNVGDKRERMINYISDKKFPFQPYQISTKTAKELFTEAFPTFIIADKTNGVLLRTSHAGDIQKYLAQAH